MANNPVVNSITFKGSVAEQASIQAQGIAGGLTFLLPNLVPQAVGNLLSVTAVNGNNVFLGFAPAQSSTVNTDQLADVEGNGTKVQLTTGAAVSPVTSELGTAANYAILAYSGITNTGASHITGGNIGSAPTTGPQAGFIFTAPAAIDNANAGAARIAGNAAFLHFSSLTPTQSGLSDLSTNDGGGGAGVYHAGVFVGASSLNIPTSITLDAQGDPSALFVFYAPSSTIQLQSGASVLLLNGAQAANVVWCVGSSFTQVGSADTMVGTILAYTSITLNGGTLNGRALAVGGGNGAVTIAAAENITATAGTGSVTAGDVVVYDAFGNVVDSGILLSSLGGAAGVTSFNGRNLAVVPALNDYSFALLSGSIATGQIPASTITIAQINSKVGNGNAVQLSNTGQTYAAGDVCTFDANGNTVDSGTLLSSLATSASVALKANIASPTFTGTVTAPTISGVNTINASASGLGIDVGAGQLIQINGNSIGILNVSDAGVAINNNTSGASVTVPTTGGVQIANAASGDIDINGVTHIHEPGNSRGVYVGASPAGAGHIWLWSPAGSSLIDVSDTNVAFSGPVFFNGADGRAHINGANHAGIAYEFNQANDSAGVWIDTSGNLYPKQAVLDASGAAGTSGQLFSSTVTGTAWISQSTLAIASGQVSGLAASATTDTTNAANISSGALALARGGTHADLSATGGASQVLRQSSVGADVTVSQLAIADLSDASTITGKPNLYSISGAAPAAGDNHIASGTITLNGTTPVPVALTGVAQFTSGTTYVVQLSYNSAPGGTPPANIYASSLTATGFNITGTDSGDTASTIGWTAIGF